MKTFRSLLPVSGLVVICALMAYAADKATSEQPRYGAPMADPSAETPLRQPHSLTREFVNDHPDLIELLMTRAALGDDIERAHTYAALTALTPVAANQILKVLEDEDANPQTRIIAMSLLETENELPVECSWIRICSALLQVSQADSEDADIRKLATLTLCRIICRLEGRPLPGPFSS